MPFRDRGSLKVWPVPRVYINWTRRGLLAFPRPTSFSVKLGGWSWNSRTRRHSIDHPGPGYWHSK